MSTLILIVAVLVLVAIAGILLVAARRPDTFRLSRSTHIDAAPERVFGLINDFHCWSAWSPWEKLDPDMKRSFSGAPAGKGAVYGWEGDGKAGSGSMQITDEQPSSHLAIALDFLKPFEAHNTAVFDLQPVGGGTQVMWEMSGPSPFMFKLMGVLMNIDKKVGADFEAGLANLKAAAERSS